MPGPPSIASSDSSGGGAPLRPPSASSTDDDFMGNESLSQDATISPKEGESAQTDPSKEELPFMTASNHWSFLPQYHGTTSQQDSLRRTPLFPIQSPLEGAFPPRENLFAPLEQDLKIPRPVPAAMDPVTPQRAYVQQAFAQQRNLAAPQQQPTTDDEAALLQASRSFGNSESSQRPKVTFSFPLVSDAHHPNVRPGPDSDSQHAGRGNQTQAHLLNTQTPFRAMDQFEHHLLQLQQLGSQPQAYSLQNLSHGQGHQLNQIPGNQAMGTQPVTMSQMPNHQADQNVYPPPSGGLPAWQSGQMASAIGDQRVGNIDSRLRLLNQNVTMTVGLHSDLGINCQNTTHDISNMIANTVHDLTRERDSARQLQAEEASRCRKHTLESGQAWDRERTKLNRELSAATENAKFWKEQTVRLKTQLRSSQEEVSTMAVDHQRFREHHTLLLRAYKNQDEANHTKIQGLEAQIVGLQAKQSAAGSSRGEASAATPQAEPNSMALVRLSDVNRTSASYSTMPSPARSIPEARGRAESINTGDATDVNVNFNPEAPTWQPAANGKTDSTTDNPPPRAPRVMRLTAAAASAAARHLRRAEAKESSSQASTSASASASNDTEQALVPLSTTTRTAQGIGHFQDTSLLDARYAEAFGDFRPVTAKSEANGQKVITFPPALSKNLVEQLWAQARLKSSWGHNDLKAALEHIYEVIKGYVVRCHDDEPFVVSDTNLVLDDPHVWEYMTKLAIIDNQHGSTHMTYLLNEPHYRPYVVQRMIVDYIFKKMFSPSIFLGYSADMDGHLAALHHQIVSMGSLKLSCNDAKARTRQKVMEDHAKLARTILGQPDAATFRRAVVDKHAYLLLNLVKSMRCQKVEERECLRLIKETATKTWISGMTVHYYFPDCGTKFQYPGMEALNARQVGRNAHQLQAAQSRIAFVVTPTVTLRDEREKGSLKTYGIRKAEILIMK
ncbi:uncharacterized protein B0I36DRAFT_393532 [Microdochium trichocladiopsis]|uniref:Uncharacterized protein n=1 Tax=Microdochium trichocladiopsis TaxID=1682393 RepID=A0A9P8XW27_9PEZI|nr:uncharacterized protein B0I36DRAFT_393532 [Microdochium trichocladiopsis]KAH7021245.1 hypothetical protein B0I36DRAFT_393532 [Microdochium trichocladiopsis]